MTPMRRSLALFLLLSVCAPLVAQTVEVPPATEGGRLIETLITAGRMDELRWPDFSDYRKHLRNLYGANGYAFPGRRPDA